MILKIHITLFIALLYNLFIAKEKVYFITYMFIIMHELSHMITALCIGVDIEEINLLPFGANARYVGNVSKVKELIITISGPLATLFFIYLYKNDIYQSINYLILFYNLLPIYPLDGGRILRNIFMAFLGNDKGLIMSKYTTIIFIIIQLVIAFYVFLVMKNIS